MPTNTVREDIRKPLKAPYPRYGEPNCLPVESEWVRLGMVEAYNALILLCDPGWGSATVGIGEHDPKAVEQGQAAMRKLENCMSVNLLCTLLETYTKVRFRVKDIDVDYEGVLREGAWGLHPDRGEQALTRRITITGAKGGWEFFVTPETEFTLFEVLERGEHR